MFSPVEQSLIVSSAISFAQGSGPDIPWLRIVGAFVVCLFLAIAAIGFLRWRQGLPVFPERPLSALNQPNSRPNKSEELAIVQRLGLGPGSQFLVLARGKQRYVLHVSQQGVTEIDRFIETDLAVEGK